MKRIYIYFLSIFAFMSMALTANAAEKEAMNVLNGDISISSTLLDNLKNVTFSETEVQLHLNNGSVVKHNYEEFDNVILGNYLVSTTISNLNSANTDFNVYLTEEKLLFVESSAIIRTLNLIETSGKTIKVNLSGNTSNIVSVSVESLAAGLYVVFADTENGQKSSKIIIK